MDVADAREKLEEYQAVTGGDFGGGEEGAKDYKEARSDTWGEFLEALESTEQPEGE